MIRLYCLLFFIITAGTAPAQLPLQWSQRYNGTANSYDIASGIDIDNAGNIVVSGTSSGSGSSNDFIIIKYTPAGNILWTYRYNGAANNSDELKDAVLDIEGNVYAAGSVSDSSDALHLNVIKVSSSGNLLWERVYSEPNVVSSYAKCIVLSETGEIITTGTARRTDGSYDIAVVWHSAGGTELRRKLITESANTNETVVKAAADNNGNIYITCTTSIPPALNTNFITYKLDRDGNILWYRKLGSTVSDDKPADIIINGDGNIIVTGSSNFISSSVDYTTIAYDSSGTVKWMKKYDGPSSDLDFPYALARDSLNNIYVTGSSRNGTTLGTEDAATVKYSSSGSFIWAAIFNGTANGSDIGSSIAVDKNGNIYTGGSTDTGSFNMAYSLLKYNPEGMLLSQNTYSVSTVSPEDFIYSVALDNADGVYVTGISFGNGTDYDIATLKYSGTSFVLQQGTEIPGGYFLYQNYPNPFNPVTVIQFDIPHAGETSIDVFDAAGRKISTLLNLTLKTGRYSLNFDAAGLPGGVYFYRFISGNAVLTRKMVLLK